MANLPPKVSAYLRPVGSASGTSWVVPSDEDTYVTFDATAVRYVEQGSAHTVVHDQIVDHTCGGYMRFRNGGGGTDPYIYYPIKLEKSGGLVEMTFRLRATATGIVNVKITLDGEVVSTGTFGIAATGVWYAPALDFVIPDNKEHEVGISMVHETSGEDAYLDLLVLTLGTFSVGSFDFDDLLTPPYVTVHSKVYILGPDGLPSSEVAIYDTKNTLDDIKTDDWYNFRTSPLPPLTSIEDDGSDYAFAIFTSQDIADHYVIWDLANEDLDPYEFAIFKTVLMEYDFTGGGWSVDEENLALRAWSFRDAFDAENCTISTPPSEEQNKIVTTFSDLATDPVFLNTEAVENDETDGEKVQLRLPDRVVSLLVDQSGSMTWNDSGNTRHELSRRMITRVDATYPGDVKWNVFSFEGTPIRVNFFAVVEDESIDTNDTDAVASTFFADQESGYAGIRVVRKTGSFPNNAIDGDIVQEGFFDRTFDDNLTEDEPFYYKVFTFDENGSFSNGVELQVTPRERIIPKGIGQFSANVMRGSGPLLDDDTIGSWHLDEGVGPVSYDFTTNQTHLLWQGTNDTPQWLNSADVPSGRSGVKFRGNSVTTDRDGFVADDSGDKMFRRDQMTVMAWVFLQEESTILQTVCARYGELDLKLDWWLAINSGIPFLGFNNNVRLVAGGTPLSYNQWHHIAVTANFDTQEYQFYLDGVPITTGTPTGAPASPNLGESTSRFSVGHIAYSAGLTNSFFGKIADVQVYNELKSDDFISDAAVLPDDFNEKQTDNGDRMLLLNYSVPSDFDYPGGRVRIVEKVSAGPADYSFTGEVDESGELIREFNGFGLEPYHENDGTVVYDDDAAAGAYVVSLSDDFVHGRTYHYKIFSQNSLGNYSLWSDAPVLSVEIPPFSESENDNAETRRTVIGDPSPSLPPTTNPIIQNGNRKAYIRWSLTTIDERVKSVEVYFSDSSYPIIDDNGIASGDADLIFSGTPDQTSFVHRNIENNVTGFYAIMTADQYGHKSTPIYFETYPEADADETGIPLLEIKKLRYELVNEESISLQWEQPIRFQKDINAWFDQRVALFAQITDEFGAPIADDSRIRFEAEASTSSAQLAEDVFGEEVDRSSFEPTPEETFILSSTPLGDGVVKGIIRMSPDFNIISAINELFLTIRVVFTVPDPSGGQDLFRFNSLPISITMKNPFRMELINQSRDRITHLCKQEVPLQDFEFIATGGLLFNPNQEQDFDGTYIRRSRPFIGRVKATYRDEAIRIGGRAFVAVHEASDPDCDDNDVDPPAKFEPSFSNRKSRTVLPPATTIDMILGFEDDGEGNLTEISYADVPLQPPDLPQGVMLFAQATYNGFIGRKRLYIAFENTLRVELTVNEPTPDCVDVAEQFASCYIIDPDSPSPSNPRRLRIPDNEICKWNLQRGISGKDRPFYSLDNVPIASGVFSYIRNNTARRVFFGPACGVTWTIVDLGPERGGPALVPEMYALKASVTYDRLNAFEERPLVLFPQQVPGSFGSRFLMSFPRYLNEMWADGYDFEHLQIARDPNSASIPFSSQFRQCANIFGGTLLVLNLGQLVELETGDSFEILHGEDLSFELDPYIDEFVFNDNEQDVGFATLPLSEVTDTTDVYLRINKFIGPPRQGGGDDDGGPVTNRCSAIELGGLREEDNDRIVFGRTSIIIDGETRFLNGGGDLENGIPPTVLRLKEPLNIRLVDVRRDGLPAEEILVDGQSQHTFVVEVSFSNKTVPNGTPILLTIGGENPSKIQLTETVVFTFNQEDPFLQNGVKSYAQFTILPLNPVESFSAQVQAECNYDKRGDVTRSMTTCLTINYDASQQNQQDDDDEEEQIAVDNVFDSKTLVYDTVNDTWDELAGLNYARGALTVNYTISPYGPALHAIGGVDGNSISARNEQYLIDINEWTEFTPMPTARMHHMAVEDAGRIYVFGGITVEDNDLVISSRVEVYDALTDEWTVLAPMPTISGREYHVALGAIEKYDNQIFIIGGLTEIDNSGGIRDFNDRILVYDIDTNTWSWSDAFTGQDYEIYHRIAPFVFLDDLDPVETTGINVFGGAILVGEGQNQRLEFPTDGFAFDPLHFNEIELNDFRYSQLPVPRYKGGVAKIEMAPGDVGVYLHGGSNAKSSTLRLLERVSGSASAPRYRLENREEPVAARQSFGMTTDGERYIYVAGGITSGRPPGFLQITAEANPTNCRLDGKQTVGIDIELRDDAGEIPPKDIRVLIRGFLIFPGNEDNTDQDSQESSSGSDQGQQSAADAVSRQAFVYPVVFSSNDFEISNGFGTTTMLGRSDDILRKIDEIKEKLGIQGTVAGEGEQDDTLLIEEGTTRQPYSIRVQITVVDDFYYGQTVINIEDNEDPDLIEDPDDTGDDDTGDDDTGDDDTGGDDDDPYAEPPGEEFQGCRSYSASKELPPDDPDGTDGTGNDDTTGQDQPIEDGLGDDSLVFSLNPSQQSQLESPSIQYFSDIEWIPQVVPHISNNQGTAEDALQIISRLNNAVPFGASPYFDGLSRVAEALLDDSADGRTKTIYSHTDNEENLSFATKDESIANVQAIDGFGQTPVVINNFSIVFPVTLSALVARTDTDSLEEIAKQTGGQSQTVLDEAFLDEILNNTLGRVAGAVGYGLYETTVDLGVDAVVHKISLDYDLFDNTDGNWTVSASSDGFNFGEVSDKFNPEAEVEFFRLSGRYFRFQATLLSGLSASVTPEYETVATPGIPAVTSININFSVPKESFIFLDPEIPEFGAQQIAVSVRSNTPPSSSIEVGAATSLSSNWIDYQSGSQPPAEQYGRIYIPIRTQQESAALNEPLENVDGFVFRAKYGRWNAESRVTVKTTAGTIIESSNYKVFPRNGLIVFNQKQTDSFIIDIENAATTRIGLRILNSFAAEPIEVGGVGYFYNTNVFLPPPLSERPPQAIDPQIFPTEPTIYSKISATYRFFDLNLDEEALDETDIRWYVNGVEVEYLRGLREWNDINNFADPVWVYAFSFEPEDVPDGTSIEQFAREQDQSLINVDDVIYFTVKPSDGKSFGSTVRSPSVTVAPAPPFLTTLNIRGRTASGRVQDTVTTAITAFADFDFFDDGGEQTSTIIWYVNGVEFKRGTLNGSNGGFNNNEIIPGEQNTQTGVVPHQIGNDLQVEVRPSAGSVLGNPVTSPVTTVQNAPPVVSNVVVTPESPSSSSNLQVAYTFFDDDIQGGVTEQSDQSSIRWYRKIQGADAFEEVTSLANLDLVPNTSTASGDQWYSEIVPFDGVDVGIVVRSNTVTVS